MPAFDAPGIEKNNTTTTWIRYGEKTMREIIQLDSRGRAALGKWAGDTTIFIIDVADDGVITLTPAIVMPILERKPATVTPIKPPKVPWQTKANLAA